MNDVLQLVSTYGFPIVMCLLFWYDKQQTSKELTSAVQNNTMVLEKLLSKLNISDVK